MSNQDGKTEDLTPKQLEERAQAAFSNLPIPELQAEVENTEAPEQEESKETEPVKSQEELASKQEIPAKDGEPEPPKAAETTPAPESKVPEKYHGKTLEEVLRIAQDQDSYIGKLGSEKSYEKSEADKFRAKLDSLESQLNTQKSQDQEESFKQTLEADPAKAVMDYVDQKLDNVSQRAEQDKLDRQTREAQTYYNGLLDNDDFKRRQTDVDRIAGALQSYVKPEYVKSADFVQICDMISKGMSVDYYIQQSQIEVASKKEVDLQEKRDAQTVSGSSSGQNTTAPSNETSLNDLEQLAKAAFVKQGR